MAAKYISRTQLVTRKFTFASRIFLPYFPTFRMKIFIDGKFCNERNAKVSVFDHGLLYGDGIFEGIRAYNGRVFRLKEHIDRLFCSAKAILLNIPMSHEKISAA